MTRRGKILFALACLLQAGLVAHVFSLGWLAGDRPLAASDYSTHYYAAFDAREHFAETGRFWGYNPEWMAGFPEGVIGLVDNKLFFLLILFTPEGWEAAVFNFAVVLCVLAPPVLIALAGFWLGVPSAGLAGAAIAAVIATFTVPLATFFWLGGGISFFLASALSAPAVAGLVASAQEGSLRDRRGIVATALAVLTVFVHPGSLPILAAGLAGVFLRHPRRMLAIELTVLGMILLLPCVSLGAAVVELREQMRGVEAGIFLQGGLDRLASDWGEHFLRTEEGWTGGAGGLFALALLGILAFAVPGTPRRSAVAVGLPAAVCLVLAYGSSDVALLAKTQPYRFLIPCAFLLSVPTGSILGHVLARPRASLSHLAIVSVAAVFALEAGIALVPSAALGPGFDPVEAPLVDFLRTTTRKDERIAVQAPWLRQPAHPGAERTMGVQRFRLLPLLVDRELLGHGGSAPLNVHQYARFSETSLLGARIDELDAEGLRTLVDRYAIAWIVAAVDDTTARLSSFSDVLEAAGTIDDLTVFRVRIPVRSRALEGEAMARASLDRIDVTMATSEEVVLRYHWVPTLEADPPVRIAEKPISGAPVGFIAVRPGGRERFTIRQRPAWWKRIR